MSSTRMPRMPIAAVLFAALFLLGCEPFLMFSGGRLSGDEAAWPNDWREVANVEEIQLETRPDDPYSLNLWIVVVDGEAFLTTSLLAGPTIPEEREWVRNVADDPRVRLRMQDGLYRGQLKVLDDDQLKTQVIKAFADKYPKADPTRSDAARFFRIEERSAEATS